MPTPYLKELSEGLGLVAELLDDQQKRGHFSVWSPLVPDHVIMLANDLYVMYMHAVNVDPRLNALVGAACAVTAYGTIMSRFLQLHVKLRLKERASVLCWLQKNLPERVLAYELSKLPLASRHLEGLMTQTCEQVVTFRQTCFGLRYMFGIKEHIEMSCKGEDHHPTTQQRRFNIPEFFCTANTFVNKAILEEVMHVDYLKAGIVILGALSNIWTYPPEMMEVAKTVLTEFFISVPAEERHMLKPYIMAAATIDYCRSYCQNRQRYYMVEECVFNTFGRYSIEEIGQARARLEMSLAVGLGEKRLTKLKESLVMAGKSFIYETTKSSQRVDLRFQSFEEATTRYSFHMYFSWLHVWADEWVHQRLQERLQKMKAKKLKLKK